MVFNFKLHLSEHDPSSLIGAEKHECLARVCRGARPRRDEPPIHDRKTARLEQVCHPLDRPFSPLWVHLLPGGCWAGSEGGTQRPAWGRPGHGRKGQQPTWPRLLGALGFLCRGVTRGCSELPGCAALGLKVQVPGFEPRPLALPCGLELTKPLHVLDCKTQAVKVTVRVT